MKLTKRERIMLPSVLIVILAALFINFVYFPVNKEVKSLQLQSDDLDAQILEAKGKQAQVEMLEKRISDQQKALEENNKDILKIWDQPELLVFMEKNMSSLCKKNTIEFFDPETADTIQTGDVNVTVNTDYDSLQKLWKKLEEAKYFNTITGFTINRASDNTEEGKTSKELEVSMNVRFYSQNTQEQYPKKYDFMNGSYGKTNIFE